MARTAVRPEPALMRIVILMTVDALRRRVAELRRLVACIALRLPVTADERERRKVMIETHILSPVGFVMTIATGLTLLACVRVIIEMARITIGTRIGFIHRGGMTRLAFQSRMTAQQREFGKSVVLETIFCPANLAMTGSTIVAQQTIVLIIRAMTGDTAAFLLHIDRAIGMTLFAAHLCVRAQQRKVSRARMVEQ